MKNWMAIFNEDTWRDFVGMTTKVCAFSDNRSRAFPAIAIGDRIICYVAKAQTWTGVLAVTGERYRAEGTYPNKVPVKCEIVIVDPASGVPMAAMEGKLSFFPPGGSAKQWAPHVRISPRVMHVPDAEALVEALTLRAPSSSEPS
jgi:hypothetical protein